MSIFWLLGINISSPMLWLEILLILLSPFIAYYIYMCWHYNTFKRLGIPGPKPSPILGTLPGIFKGGFSGHDKELMEKYGEVVGCFMGRFPVLLIADVTMLREILTKQFNNFANRSKAQFDTLSSNMLHMAQEEKWRNLRATLSPTFSSGKLKKICVQINTCSDQLTQHLDQCCTEETEIDFKEYADAFTMDCIATTAFGLRIDSQKERKNKFVEMANISMAKTLKSPLFVILFFFPFMMPFMEKLGYNMFPKEGTSFFQKITEQIITNRKSQSQKYLDFVQLMINAHKEELKDEEKEEIQNEEINQKIINGKKKALTKTEILANAVLFFLAGYETTANTLSFLVHLLAVNQDVQVRLQQEVDDICQGEEARYEDLHKMYYLQQVIDETLRLFPQSPRLDRVAREDVIINNYKIPKGTWIAIPVKYLHYNSKYWENPEKFDPDRFSPEEKSNREPYCYLPFGLGPRNCIGMRLALVELKLAVIKIVQKFQILACSKTQESLKSELMRPKPEGGVFVKLQSRK